MSPLGGGAQHEAPLFYFLGQIPPRRWRSGALLSISWHNMCMGDSRCAFSDGCDSDAYSRGLCKYHYGVAYRNGTLNQYPRRSERAGVNDWHRLTNVDPSELLADCSICGPAAEIRLRPPRPSEKRSAECMTMVREHKKRWGKGRKRDRSNWKKKKYVYPLEQRRKWASSSPEQRRESRLKATYGITLDDFERMREAQGGRCAICGTSPDRLVVDHCHESGKVRGLLCAHCNISLGFMRDDPSAARKASEYLSG
jgi:hypothetical protein